MPAPPWPTTAARSCCSIRRASPPMPGSCFDQSEFEKRSSQGRSMPQPPREETPALAVPRPRRRQRAIRLAVVERIEDVPADAIRLSAGRLRVALGDQILPLCGCDDGAPRQGKLAHPAPDRRRQRARLRLCRGRSTSSTLARRRAARAAPGEVAGVALIDGEQVEIARSLLAVRGLGRRRRAPTRRAPVCALPAGDPWMENMLRPLLESAGYRVVAADRVAADAAMS